MDNEAAESYVPQHRRTNFKNKGRFSADELRRRRETQQVELRKLRRDDMLAKRRNLEATLDDSDDEGHDDDQEFLQQLQQKLPRMMQELASNDFNSQLNATVKFRQILLREHNPPIDLVIRTGVVPTLIEFMKEGHPDLLQLEAAWALTNIALGTSDQTKVVVDAGAVPHFVLLLYLQLLEVREQAIWALGNIAGDLSQYRDQVLACGAMLPTLLLFGSTKMSLLRTATWTLSNLCRGKNPQPDWDVVVQALPILAKLIYSTDTETLIDACWAISYLSDGPTKAIQAVIDARIPRRLVELLGHESNLVKTPALRAVGNIVTGNDSQTQCVINAGVLPALAPLLNNPKESIRKEACWTISNITAGNTDQIQAVIDANLIPPLVHILESAEYKTKKEACWAISNASSGGLTRPEQIKYLVQQGCIKPLCDLLLIGEVRIVEVALDALENILKLGETEKELRGDSVNQNAIFIEEAGGLEKIIECQRNENNQIYEKAYSILARYFGDEEDDEGINDGDIEPANDGGSYAFGGGQQGGFQF